eukprot:4517470-Prymnesium_polylepis.1
MPACVFRLFAGVSRFVCVIPVLSGSLEREYASGLGILSMRRAWTRPSLAVRSWRRTVWGFALRSRVPCI